VFFAKTMPAGDWSRRAKYIVPLAQVTVDEQASRSSSVTVNRIFVVG
jgi:hypothetical protein